MNNPFLTLLQPRATLDAAERVRKRTVQSALKVEEGTDLAEKFKKESARIPVYQKKVRRLDKLKDIAPGWKLAWHRVNAKEAESKHPELHCYGTPINTFDKTLPKITVCKIVRTHGRYRHDVQVLMRQITGEYLRWGADSYQHELTAKQELNHWLYANTMHVNAVIVHCLEKQNG